MWLQFVSPEGQATTRAVVTSGLESLMAWLLAGVHQARVDNDYRKTVASLMAVCWLICHNGIVAGDQMEWAKPPMPMIFADYRMSGAMGGYQC